MRNLLFISLCCILFSCSTDEKVEVTILGESATSIQSMMALENDYESNNPDIDLIFKPNSFDEAFNKANVDFANKTGIYDIVMQYNFSLGSFVTNDYVYPINSLLEELDEESLNFETDMFESAWREVGFYKSESNDGLDELMKVGYPFTANTMMLAYNKEMFNNIESGENFYSEYGYALKEPNNWKEFYDIAEFFTNPDEKTFGVCLQGANGGWLYYEWMNFLFNMGGMVMDKEYGWQGDAESNIYLDSEASISAASYYVSLKPFNKGSFTAIDAYEQITLLQEGNVAMGIIWSDLAYSLIENEDGSLNEKFGFAVIPGEKSMLAGGSYFINKNSDNPKEAIKYIVDLMQYDNQVKLAKTGLCSALKSVYDHPEVSEIPYSNALKASLDRGTYMLEAGIDATLISDVITSNMQRLWNEELTAEEATKTMQQEVDEKRQTLYNSFSK